MIKKTNKILKTKFYSWKLNNLPEGCKQCVSGDKSVIFVTGICPRQCSYCPLSEEKKDSDVIFINERKIFDEKDFESIITEIKSCNSKGAGFTGGDPLSRIDRTCEYIKLLKKHFGKKFHIHLYTSLDLINDTNLKKLDDSGLDELRFHPELINDKLWHKINLLYSYSPKDADKIKKSEKTGKRKYSFKLGIEIPVIPYFKKQTIKLIDFFADKVDFINLNELEISDAESFKIKNVSTKNDKSYGAKGSQELGIELLEHINKNFKNSNAHFCTCKLKDKVQLGNRLKKRATNTKKIFDIITDDGTLIRGAIYTKNSVPSFNYKKNLEKISDNKKVQIIKDLEIIREKLIESFNVPKKYLEIDNNKLRIITNVGIVEKLSDEIKMLNGIPAIVEQYPTWDQMEVDITFL